MGLRELIEAKQRRTARLPILVGNPSAAAAEVGTFRSALAVHQQLVAARKKAGKKSTKADREREEQLRSDLQGALDRQASCVVEIELQSLPDDQWEALFGDLEPDAQGELDLTAIHAPLLAASCTDPELQDPGWWAEQLARPEWTDGDKAAVSRVLLELNVYAPRFDALGKG